MKFSEVISYCQTYFRGKPFEVALLDHLYRQTDFFNKKNFEITNEVLEYLTSQLDEASVDHCNIIDQWVVTFFDEELTRSIYARQANSLESLIRRGDDRWSTEWGADSDFKHIIRLGAEFFFSGASYKICFPIVLVVPDDQSPEKNGEALKFVLQAAVLNYRERSIKLLLPLNQNQGHWLLAKVAIDRGKITDATLFDSMGGSDRALKVFQDACQTIDPTIIPNPENTKRQSNDFGCFDYVCQEILYCIGQDNPITRARTGDDLRKAIGDVIATKIGLALPDLEAPRPLTPPARPQDSILDMNYVAGGLKNSLHGNIFQLKLLMCFVQRALDCGNVFRLATEMQDAGNLDDVFFEYINQKTTTVKKYRFLQAKHKQDDNIKITEDHLLKESVDDGNFYLVKYFIAYRHIKKNPRFTEGEIQDVTLCTNIGLEEGLKEKNFFIINEDDAIFSFRSKTKQTARYKFKDKLPLKQKLYESLRTASDVDQIADKLVKHLTEKKKTKLTRTGILKSYLDSLCGEVIDPEEFTDSKGNTDRKFSKKFLQGDNLSLAAKRLREKLLQHLGEARLQGARVDTIKDFGKGVSSPLPNDLVTDSEIDEFLEKLVFAVDQPNENELSQILKESIYTKFNLIDNQMVLDRFLSWMLDWMKVKEGRFLTKTEAEEFFDKAECELAQLIMLGPTFEYKESLKRYLLDFNSPVKLAEFLRSDKRVLAVIAPQVTWITSIKIFQYLSKEPCFEQNGSYYYLRVRSAVLLLNPLLAAFKVDSCKLLVIECDNAENYLDLSQHLKALLEVKPDKKIILIITDLEDALFASFKTTLSWQEHRDNDTHFRDLNSKTQTNLKERQVNFQGQMTTVGEVLGENIGSLTRQALVEACQDATILQVGHALIPLSELESFCYISRTITRANRIKLGCLKKNSDDFFVISKLPDEKMLTPLLPTDQKVALVKELNKYKNSNEPPPRYWIAGSSSDTEGLKEHYLSKKIHFLEWAGDHLIWKMSQGSLAGIYFDFDQENQQAHKEESWDISAAVTVVAAEPGMGKSTFFKKIAVQLKENNPKLWVVNLNLSDHATELDSMIFREGAEFVEKFISKTETLTSFARQVLASHWALGLVRIFLDGFDEISPTQQTKVMQLINVVAESRNKCLVATRIHLRRSLEEQFSVQAYSLQPFSMENKIEFMTKLWSKNSRLTETGSSITQERLIAYARALVERFDSSMSDKQCSFISIPLQARLLAEAFQSECFQFCESSATIPSWSEPLDLVQLYQKFITQKYAIYFKQRVKLTMRYTLFPQKAVEKVLNKLHCQRAMEVMFPACEASFGFHLDLEAEQALLDVGIWQKGANASFIHRTFAEYFSAEWIISALQKTEGHKQLAILSELILRQLFVDSNKIIRSFVEQRLKMEDVTELARKRWEALNLQCLSASKTGASSLLINQEVTETKVKIKEDALNDPEKFLRKFLGRVDPNAAMVEIKEFIARSKQLADLEQFTTIFRAMANLAKKSPLLKTKELIVNHALEMANHYLSLLFKQPTSQIKIDYELLSAFTKINFSTYDNFSVGANIVADRGKEAVEVYEKELKKYFELQDMITNGVTINLDSSLLNKTKILYLRLSPFIFNEEQIRFLQQLYVHGKRNHEDFDELSENFRMLFLKINLAEVGLVKNFFIEEQLIYWLIMLYQQFPSLTLGPEDLRRIYANKDQNWLINAGTDLVKALWILNADMCRAFCAPLGSRALNRSYAYRLMHILILPCLEEMASKSTPLIDVESFLKLVTSLLEYINKARVSIDMTKAQLLTLVQQIENRLNRRLLINSSRMFKPLPSKDLLTLAVRLICVLSSNFDLKIIILSSELLLIEPDTGKSYSLKLDYHQEVAALIKLRLIEEIDDALLLKKADRLQANLLAEIATQLAPASRILGHKRSRSLSR